MSIGEKCLFDGVVELKKSLVFLWGWEHEMLWLNVVSCFGICILENEAYNRSTFTYGTQCETLGRVIWACPCYLLSIFGFESVMGNENKNLKLKLFGVLGAEGIPFLYSQSHTIPILIGTWYSGKICILIVVLKWYLCHIFLILSHLSYILSHIFLIFEC